MLKHVCEHMPSSWDMRFDRRELPILDHEYQQIKNELKQALNNNVPIVRILKIQDHFSFGQFLIREQLLLNIEPLKPLYRVRRFVTVRKSYLNCIINFNLDPRRCGFGSSLTLSSSVNSFSNNTLIVVVKVLTNNPEASVIQPSTSASYYVEYIVEV